MNAHLTGASFAPVFGAPPVRRTAVRAVAVHLQVASAPVTDLGRDLVEAGLPHDGLPAAGNDLAVTWPAAQLNVHL